MKIQYGLISCDSHAQLHKDAWTSRMSRAKFGDRILSSRQCHLTACFDSTGLKTRDHIGLDNLLWSTNFPQATSTWQESRRAIARCFDGIPENERRQVLVDNAARLYNLPRGAD